MPAVKVPLILPELRTLAEDMIATMQRARGVGLAAQQVGRIEAICVVDMPLECDYVEEEGPRLNPDITFPLVLMNPEILETSRKKCEMDEGCLSFPDIRGAVKRHWSIWVRYLGLDGDMHETWFHGYLARIIQHEMEHLAGDLFIDRFSHVKKLAVRNRLRLLQKDTMEKIEYERSAAPPEYSQPEE
jgi:peptide deformylase